MHEMRNKEGWKNGGGRRVKNEGECTTPYTFLLPHSHYHFSMYSRSSFSHIIPSFVAQKQTTNGLQTKPLT